MTRVYLAGPLFSAGEQMWCRHLKGRLEADLGVEVFWALEAVPAESIPSMGYHAPQAIFKACLDELERCDLMVAILDGPMVDDGTAWEMGYFYARHPGGIYGIRTDFRRAGETPHSTVNAMLQGCCARVAGSVSELVRYLKESLV